MVEIVNNAKAREFFCEECGIVYSKTVMWPKWKRLAQDERHKVIDAHKTARPIGADLKESQMTKRWEDITSPPSCRCYVCALEKALAMALLHSTLTIRSRVMIDILGRDTVDAMSREDSEDG